jgi:hypothetical protein
VHASDELLELVAFMGLRNVLPDGGQATTRAGPGARTAGRAAPCPGRT